MSFNMIIYVSGGCKNGKSSLAEDWAKTLSGGKPLYYIATMIPHDSEDNARIERPVSIGRFNGLRIIIFRKDMHVVR